MDDARNYLTPAQLILVNNVRMYLRISMLSEITHSNGLQILEHLLEPTAQPLPSTLAWPHQPCPPKVAWHEWKRAIQRLYTKGSTNQLTQALGAWIPHATHAQWQWDWLVCPISLTLYQRQTTTWDSYEVIAHRRRYATYDVHPT